VQTTWLTLLESLDKIHTPQALAGWLVTVTRREAWRVRALHRRNDQFEPQEFAEWPDPAGDIESSVVDDEQNYALWRNLRQLPPRCQELLRIAAFADRPDYTAIAEALGMARGSIGPTRGRCLAKLRVLLANDPGWGAP
jgi:RNA polymerase sigma factor (sigma-70 family)